MGETKASRELISNDKRFARSEHRHRLVRRRIFSQGCRNQNAELQSRTSKAHDARALSVAWTASVPDRALRLMHPETGFGKMASYTHFGLYLGHGGLLFVG
jgi:hypothetical protein